MKTNLRFHLPGLIVLLTCLCGLAASDLKQPGLAQPPDVIVAYPLPPFAATSSDFHITANNTAVPVEHYRDRHVAHLAATGEVALKITINSPITSYSIHPASFGVKAAVAGNSLAVALTPTQFNPQPAYLLLKINDLENLVLLVDPPEENPPLPHDRGVQDITAAPYLADPSGKLLATTAMQSAIDQVAQSGSGIVYVPAGLFRVQSLKLKSGVTLYLAGGAVIEGSGLLADYAQDASFLNSKNKTLPPVIDAHDFKNVTIRGRGRIDAATGAIVTPEGIRQEVEPRGPYHRVALHASDGEGFTLEGITAQDGAGWSLLLHHVDHIQITRLKLLGPMWRGNDGIDICGGNAVVDQCFVYTGDDNFCTKALLAGYPLHDIHFRNSIGYGNAGGVKAGMQVRSPQTAIYFENIDIIHAGRGLVVEHRGEDSNEKGASPMQNIYFTDIRVEQVSGTGGTSRNPIQIKSELPGAICNIFFQRVSVASFGPKPSLISGYDAANPVTNVVFDNLTIGGKLIDSLAAGDMQTKNAAEIKFLHSATPK